LPPGARPSNWFGSAVALPLLGHHHQVQTSNSSSILHLPPTGPESMMKVFTLVKSRLVEGYYNPDMV
jgi:hypothetical protein